MENQSRPATGYPASAYPPPPNSAATAYPYAAPPPPHPSYYYPNNNQNPHYPNAYVPDPRAAFARRLFAVLVASFLVALTVALALWLVLRPRLPDFTLSSLSLSNLNLSSSSSSSSLLTADFAVDFSVLNPNKKITFYYDHLRAAVYYSDSDDSLAETALPPFVQPTRNRTSVGATLAAAGAYVGKSVAEGINGSLGGSVRFNVRVVGRVRLKAGWWRARQRYLRVYCGDLAVALNSSRGGGGVGGGTLVGGPRECRVAL